jgi:hypothetical protein
MSTSGSGRRTARRTSIPCRSCQLAPPRPRPRPRRRLPLLHLQFRHRRQRPLLRRPEKLRLRLPPRNPRLRKVRRRRRYPHLLRRRASLCLRHWASSLLRGSRSPRAQRLGHGRGGTRHDLTPRPVLLGRAPTCRLAARLGLHDRRNRDGRTNLDGGDRRPCPSRINRADREHGDARSGSRDDRAFARPLDRRAPWCRLRPRGRLRSSDGAAGRLVGAPVRRGGGVDDRRAARNCPRCRGSAPGSPRTTPYHWPP